MTLPGFRVAEIVNNLQRNLRLADVDALNRVGLRTKQIMLDESTAAPVGPPGYSHHKRAMGQKFTVRYSVKTPPTGDASLKVWPVPPGPYLAERGRNTGSRGTMKPMSWFDRARNRYEPIAVQECGSRYLDAIRRSL